MLKGIYQPVPGNNYSGYPVSKSPEMIIFAIGKYCHLYPCRNMQQALLSGLSNHLAHIAVKENRHWHVIFLYRENNTHGKKTNGPAKEDNMDCCR